MPVGAAVGGAIGAAGSIGSALIGSNASKDAAAQQAATARQALALQQQMFSTAQGALSPYYTAGQGVLPTLSSLLTPGPSQTATLEQLPGFNFASEWGTLSAKNALSAEGLGGSTGPLAKAISDYNSGLASTNFGNLVGYLQNFANMGEGAAGALAGNATTAGSSMAGTTQAIGNAQAAGTLGSANALAGGLTGGTNAITNALLLSSLQSGNGGGIYKSFSGPAWGGGGIFSGDAYGGNPSNPLPGLTAEDYSQ